MNYSVLMSVYQKEEPQNLKQSIESILNQTIQTNDFVIICDGRLTKELDDIINYYSQNYPDIFNIVRLSQNVGLGRALRIGVLECKNEIIARMDSDDISNLSRCEKELKYLEENINISIVGSWIEEFENEPGDLNSIRKVPETNPDIVQYCKMRSPFNHPSVMFRKHAILNSGNYSDLRFMQDYDLWYRLIKNNYEGYNIQESLVFMRTGEGLYKRRSGSEHWRIQVYLLKRMKNDQFISLFEYYLNLIIRRLTSLVPNNIRKAIYNHILRKNKS